jgi:antitoxin (DNA-binding transcriptional repressor) of toxin-antitoxin stability system
MERIDISDDRRVADLVEAVERGDEVVIVRDGVVVATVAAPDPAPSPEPKRFDMAALEALRAKYPIRIGDAAALIREIRDEGDH